MNVAVTALAKGVMNLPNHRSLRAFGFVDALAVYSSSQDASVQQGYLVSSDDRKNSFLHIAVFLISEVKTCCQVSPKLKISL